MNGYFDHTEVAELPQGSLGYRAFAGSIDSKCTICLVTFPQGQVVFVSGEPGPKFGSVAEIRLGNDGSSFAYMGVKDEKYYVVTGGKISSGYDWVGKLCLSRDGKALAYPIMKETPTNQEYRMITNGNLGNAYDCIGEAVWHPANNLLAYVAESASSERVVFGDELLPRFERIRGLQFSPAGRLYYWAFKEGDWRLCDESGTVERSEGDGTPVLAALLFGPKGELGYWVCKRQNWFVQFGGQRYGPYSGFQRQVGSPRLSEDSVSVVYVTENEEQTTVCRDGISGGEFDAVGTPVSRAGLLAYKARIGNAEYLILNEQKGEGFPVSWPEEAEKATYLEDTPVISRNGSRVAFRVSAGNLQGIAINGVVNPMYQRVNGQPSFDGESDRLVYGAQNGQQYFVVNDSQEIGPFDLIFSAKKSTGLVSWDWSPEFSNDGHRLHFFCVENRKILKCAIDL